MEHVRSLTSLISTRGRKWVDVARAMASPKYPIDEENWREAGRTMFDRDPYPPGVIRVGRATADAIPGALVERAPAC